MRRKQGITLVSIIITVILLLILAGVAIAIAIDGNGLFNRANEAKNEWEESQVQETNVIEWADEQLQLVDKVEVTDNVQISIAPEGWTSSDVTITFTYENVPGGYEIQYKIGDGEWQTGTETTVIENTNVFARLYHSGIEDEIAINSKVISNIDKANPTAPTSIVKTGYINSIEVKAEGGTDSLSGVAGYQYSINGSDYTTTIPVDQTYTFENIKANTEVVVYARTIDNVGNMSEVYQETGKTATVQNNITMDREPTTWVNGNVSITLSHDNIPSGYRIQYKVGNEEWVYGTTAIVTTNNTTVLGRLYHESLDDEIGANSVTITNIDKVDPIAPTSITKTENLNSIVVKAEGGTDSLSGVAGYQYSINGSTYTNTIAVGNTYTFSNMKANTSVTIYARTVDNVGRISSVYQVSGKTANVGSNVSLAYNGSAWVNANVVVTLSHSSVPSGYVIQYKVGNGAWTTGTSATVTTNNTTVYGRLYHASLNDAIGANSVTVTNIDKVNPTAPTQIINAGVNTNTIIVRASGGTDSLSGVAGYQYRINGGAWSATKGAGANHTFGGLATSTSYTIEARTVDRVGRASGSIATTIKTTGITASMVASNPSYYYGKTVTNYICTNGAGVNAWKIFYADSENIYLIADNYIHLNYVPAKNGWKVNSGNGYKFNFSGVGGYHGSSEIRSDPKFAKHLSKWNKLVQQNPGYDSWSIVSTAYMLDTGIWSVFANSTFADYAIGGPTIELFAASYNQTHSVDILLQVNSDRYLMKPSDSTGGYGNHMVIDSTNPLYIIKDTSRSNSMWLASISGFDFVMDVRNENNATTAAIYLTYFETTGNGFRPVVCLNTSTKLIDLGNGTFQLTI